MLSHLNNLRMDIRHILVLGALAVVAQAFSLPSFEKKIDKRWKNFKTKYNKKYPEASEKAKRHAIWYNNTQLIKNHNILHHEGKTTFKLGPNANMDMTVKEIAAHFNGFKNKTSFDSMSHNF